MRVKRHRSSLRVRDIDWLNSSGTDAVAKVGERYFGRQLYLAKATEGSGVNNQDWGVDSPEQTYWYNTRTETVEEGKLSLSIDRVGPFATREEAARAPEILAERARKWAEEDAAENE